MKYLLIALLAVASCGTAELEANKKKLADLRNYNDRLSAANKRVQIMQDSVVRYQALFNAQMDATDLLMDAVNKTKSQSLMPMLKKEMAKTNDLKVFYEGLWSRYESDLATMNKINAERP